MSNFLIAPAIMTGLGLFFAVILAVAYGTTTAENSEESGPSA